MKLIMAGIAAVLVLIAGMSFIMGGANINVGVPQQRVHAETVAAEMRSLATSMLTFEANNGGLYAVRGTMTLSVLGGDESLFGGGKAKVPTLPAAFRDSRAVPVGVQPVGSVPLFIHGISPVTSAIRGGADPEFIAGAGSVFVSMRVSEAACRAINNNETNTTTGEIPMLLRVNAIALGNAAAIPTKGPGAQGQPFDLRGADGAAVDWTGTAFTSATYGNEFAPPSDVFCVAAQHPLDLQPYYFVLAHVTNN